MATSRVDSVNFWNNAVPAKFHGSTVIVIVDEDEDPVAFWLGSNEGKAYYSTVVNQRIYELGDPNGVLPYMRKAVKGYTSKRFDRFFRYFDIATGGNAVTKSLQDHYVDATLKGTIKKRVKSQNFRLRGGAAIMGSEIDDDLLAALVVEDDEPDRPKKTPPRAEEDEKLPPHRRSNPPNKIRNPDAYVSSLKSGG